MRKSNLLSLLLLAATCVFSARADIVIDGTSYHADTLVHRQVGPGMINAIVRLPDYPLNIYVVTADLNNPNNRVETTFGYGVLGKTELLSEAVKRHRTPTKRPVAACNANFWVVSGSQPLSLFMKNSPQGGVVRNDTTIVNDNNTYDQWNGGATWTGVAAITSDKTLVMGHVRWSGHIAAAKLSQPIEFQNINRRAVTGEICLWNEAYGRTREFEDDWVGFSDRGDNASDNYYLTFAQGEDWKTNHPMTFVVAQVVQGQDRQTLGDYDACLTVTGVDPKAAMAALTVGDTLQLTSMWTNIDGDAATALTDVANLVTGNATIMHNGQLTSRNYNESYNTNVYSRTCYGTSADGKHLYMLVIDKSQSPLYGKSSGCTTAQACQILQQMCPDVNDMVNMDAGGSAEMLVHGEIINTTVEGNPRGVATGWMIEAIGEEDCEIASIAFDQHRIDMATYATATPRILGYNSIGELIDTDVKGFTLSCDPVIGTASGTEFVAAGQEASGYLTASLGDIKASVLVHVMAAEPSIVLKPILIDQRDYPVEVSAQIVDNTYFYDPASLVWSLDDNSVATINDGVLRGVANGTTTLGCTVGPFVDETPVTVELSPTRYIYQTWDGWTTKGSGAKNIALNQQSGEVTYTYSSHRSPYVQLSKDLTFYGLPDTIGLVFNSTAPIDYVQIDCRNRKRPTSTYLKYYSGDGDETFAAGVDHKIVFNLEPYGSPDYAGTYPLMLKLLKFYINKDTEAGEQSIALKSLYCHYPDTGIARAQGDVNRDGEVTIADVNDIISAILLGQTWPDADVNRDGEINLADVNLVIDLILSR